MVVLGRVSGQRSPPRVDNLAEILPRGRVNQLLEH
jgi:hypothetical protein